MSCISSVFERKVTYLKNKVGHRKAEKKNTENSCTSQEIKQEKKISVIFFRSVTVYDKPSKYSITLIRPS